MFIETSSFSILDLKQFVIWHIIDAILRIAGDSAIIRSDSGLEGRRHEVFVDDCFNIVFHFNKAAENLELYHVSIFINKYVCMFYLNNKDRIFDSPSAHNLCKYLMDIDPNFKKTYLIYYDVFNLS